MKTSSNSKHFKDSKPGKQKRSYLDQNEFPDKKREKEKITAKVDSCLGIHFGPNLVFFEARIF